MNAVSKSSLLGLILALPLGGALVPLSMASAEAVVPTLSIDDVTVQEPSGTGALSGPGSIGADNVPAVFTVTLDQPAPGVVSVNFRTVMTFPLDEFPRDIQATSGTLTIEAGEQSGEITVLVNIDYRYEPTEYFTVELDEPSGAVITDGTGLGTILNSNRDGFFSCSGTGFWYHSEYSRTFQAYGEANTERGRPDWCWPDHGYEAGWFDNGTVHAFVDPVPNYLQWGAFAINGLTSSNPRYAGRSIPLVGDGGTGTGEVTDGSVTTTSGATLKFDAARADASIRCVAVGANPPAPVMVGTSHLRGLTVGKSQHAYTTEYAKRPFGIGGQLEFNKQTLTPLADGMRLTQQAIVISNSGGDTWVLGEALVEYHGNPCRY